MDRLARVLLLLLVALVLARCSSGSKVATEHRTKGNDHLKNKDWAQAVTEYTLSLEADPKQEKVWQMKAYAHLQAGQTEDAGASLLKILELKETPEEKAEVYRNVGHMYLKAKVPDKAEEYFNEVVKIEPEDENTWGWLAEIYAWRGGARSMEAPIVPADLEKALTYYDKVVEINPNSANTYLNKRVVVARFMEYERKQKVSMEAAAQYAGDASLAAEARAKAAAHQARMDELKKEFDELTKKFSEAKKAAG